MNNFINPRMPIDLLQELIESDDISKVYISLDYLKENIHIETDNKILSQWSEILQNINLHNSPDLQLLYADIFYELYNYNSKKVFPDWKSWRAPIVVQIKWRQLEFYLRTDKINFNDIDEITLQGLFDLDSKKILYPEIFYEKICSSNNYNIQNITLKLLRESLNNCILLPNQAYEYLMQLCRTSNLLVLKDTLEFLSEGWAQCEDYPKVLIEKAIKTESFYVKKSAVKLLESLNQFDKLELILKDEKQNPLIRCEAMRALGRSTKKDLIDDILSISSSDSLCFGEACFNALETFHHCGIFIKEKHLDDLIKLFIENNKCSEHIFEMITFTCREQLVLKLDSLKDDFDIWNRLCLVIPLLQTDSKIKMMVNILERVSDISIKKGIIKVIGMVGGKAEEEIILNYLEDCPQECLNALKYIGTEKTVDILWYALGVETDNHFIAPYIFPYQKEALTLLWYLSKNEKQDILKVKLNPANIPSGIICDIVPTLSEIDLKLLLLQKDLVAEEVILTLCQYGSSETIEEISQLLMRHVSEIATNKHFKDVDKEEHIKEEYKSEPVVSNSIREAIIKFGENLFKRGKLRPVYILKAETAHQAGEILLSEIVFEIIENRTLSPEEIRILLETVENIKYNNISLRIRKLIRHKEPQIRKMVIRCLVKQHAIGHSFDILRLFEKDDIETIRQAIIATEEFNAVWAGSYVVRCLEHPNMNIKKTAAKALSKIGDNKIVKSLVFWLSHHDNYEFRQLLKDALKAVAGPGYILLILRELEKSNDERKTELLLKTFDLNINKELVKNLLRNKSKASQIVIEALIDGRIRLIYGSIIELINSENNLYKDEFNKLISKTKFKHKKVLTSDILIESNDLWDKNEIKGLLRRRSLSDSEMEFFILHFPREWLDFISETESFSMNSVKKFLEIAEKSFTAKHYEIIADKVFVILKILQSNIVTLDLAERIIQILDKVFTLLPKSTLVKATAVIREIPTVIAPEYDWAYKLIKQSNCILLDSDVYSIIFKLNARDRINLLKDAYKLSFINYDMYEHTSCIIENKDGLNVCQYKNTLETLFHNLIKNSNHDDKENFHLLQNMLPLNVPSWSDRKSNEGNKEIETRKINTSKQSIICNNQHKQYLLNLLNDPDSKISEKAAAAILDWDEVKSAKKQVFTSYLDGKINFDSKYQNKLQELLPAFTTDWFITQTKTQSEQWVYRLLQLISTTNTLRRQDYISWLYGIWQINDGVLSKKAYDCLVGIDPFVLIGESIKYAKVNQKLAIKGDSNIEYYEIICQQLKNEGLLHLKNIKPLFLSENQIKELNKLYKELHSSVNHSVIDPIEDKNQLCDLINDAKSNDSQKIILALKKLSKFKSNNVIDVVTSLIDHSDSKVRSNAHRCLRQVSDRQHYLNVTCKLLQDPIIDVRRSAIRTLSFSKYEPAIPLIINLLSDNNPKLRKYASEGLKIMGSCTISKLIRAEKKARPDHKYRYREIIDYIQAKADKVNL